MRITSATICAAADRLQGFVGYNRKTAQYIVRFSEDAFGLDVLQPSIIPCCEFVWQAFAGNPMRLDRSRLQLLFAQNLDDRLNISEPLRLYMRRQELAEITAQRSLIKPRQQA